MVSKVDMIGTGTARVAGSLKIAKVHEPRKSGE